MPTYNPANSPEQNLATLAENPYPGRLLIVGQYAGGILVQAYALMGRSEGSRNRRLVATDNTVSTQVADPSLPVGNVDLTIYDAMRRIGSKHVVSNGDQTGRVVRYWLAGKTFSNAMAATEYEPDAPHFTPRITAFHDTGAPDGQPRLGISVIRRSRRNPSDERTIRREYTDQSPELARLQSGGENVGYCVHTYLGGGNPLPSFNEPPFAIPTQPTAEAMAAMVWEHLDPVNRVAVVAKTICDGQVGLHIINAHA